jgi:LysM repeat protein
MKRIVQNICLLIVFLSNIVVLNAQQISISNEIIEENGTKFYLHTIEKGQTIYSIAKTYKVDVEDIYKYNEWAKDKIKIGEKLKIPFPKSDITKSKILYDTIYHVVKPKETLYSISKQYNVDIEDLRYWNREILASGILRINDSIIVGIKERKADDLSIINKQKVEIDKSTITITYEVKEGETLYFIAKQFNTSTDSIVKWNNLPSYFVKSGQQLIIKQQKENLSSDNKCKKGRIPSEITIAAFIPALDELRPDMLSSKSNIAVNYLDGYNYIQFYEALLLLENMENDYVTSFKIIPIPQNKNKKEFDKDVSKVNWQDVDIVLGPLDEEFLYLTLPLISEKHLWIHYIQKLNVDTLLPEVQFLSNITEQLETIAEYLSNNMKKDTPIYIYHTSDSTEKYNARYLKNILLNKYGFNNVNFSTTISSLPSKLTTPTVIVALTINEPTAGNIVRYLGTTINDLEYLSFFCPSSWLYFDNLDFYFLNKISPYIMFNNCYLDKNNTEIISFINEFIKTYNTFPSIYAFYAYETMNFLNELIRDYGSNYKNCITNFEYKGKICDCTFKNIGNAKVNSAAKIGRLKDYKVEIGE